MLSSPKSPIRIPYNISKIHTFRQVQFFTGLKPLVVCDIDHTVLRCSYGFHHFQRIVLDHYRLFPQLLQPTTNIYHEAGALLDSAYRNGYVQQSDPEGLAWMRQIAHDKGGRFVFLTSRDPMMHEQTLKELKKAGVGDVESLTIYYTGKGVSKGQYLKQSKIAEGYDYLSFIDDHGERITSVQQYFPYSYCYMFDAYGGSQP